MNVFLQLLAAVDALVELALVSVAAVVVAAAVAVVVVEAAAVEVAASTSEAWAAQQTTWSLARRLSCFSPTTTSA